MCYFMDTPWDAGFSSHSLRRINRVGLRRATCRDQLVLFEIHRTAFLPHIARIWGWDERQQRASFLEEVATTNTWVVETDSGIAGYLQVKSQAGRLYVRNMALLPEFQRRGIGTWLVQKLQTKAAARGMPIELSVLRTNVPARRFYERLGFVRTRDAQAHFEMTWHAPSVSNRLDC